MSNANDNRPERRRQPGAALLLLAAVTACGAKSPAPASAEVKVWVGEVAGSDVALGIVATAAHSTLFFCGGNSSFADHSHWFVDKGPLAEAEPVVDGTWQVTIGSLSDRIEGTVTIAGLGASLFSADGVAPGTLTGVYDAFAPCGHAGLIVRQAASTDPPAAQGTCLDSAAGTTAIEQVNPVMPVMRGADSGISASLASDPAEQLTLHPLTVGN